MRKARFIGIDLAWKSERNATGAVCLQGDRTGAELVAVAPPLWSAMEVLEFVQANAAAESVVAVDAPLIIANRSGQRPCEALVGKRYGHRDASCHTSNLSLYPEAASVALAKSIEAEGYVHANHGSSLPARVIVEVYPHAGMVALFDLPKIIKYKKGSVAEKRIGLDVMRVYLATLDQAEPRFNRSTALTSLLSENLGRLVGQGLKSYEDSLDVLFCAYLAYYFWYWGWEKTEVFGDVQAGYILNPRLVPGGITCAEIRGRCLTSH
jgi:predicted RNase H-like nuclease